MYPILIFLLLFLNWIVLSGKFDALHLGLGLISCGVVTWLSQDLLYHDRKKNAESRLQEAIGFVKYLPWITWEVVKANLHVFKLAMTRAGSEEIAPRVVTYKTYLKSDFAKFVLANSITLTPGTISVFIQDGWITIHTLQADLADLEESAMDQKVKGLEVKKESA